MTWIISKVNSIPTHCSVAYESVLSLAQCLRLRCRMLRHYQKRSKKRISTSNFEISSHQNVTAKKPIGNMYFMYVDIAWFHSLSRLEHDMLHLTVWPVHKICPMSMCWRPYPTRTKRIHFLPFLPGMLSVFSNFCKKFNFIPLGTGNIQVAQYFLNWFDNDLTYCPKDILYHNFIIPYKCHPPSLLYFILPWIWQKHHLTVSVTTNRQI